MAKKTIKKVEEVAPELTTEPISAQASNTPVVIKRWSYNGLDFYRVLNPDGTTEDKGFIPANKPNQTIRQ